MGLVQKVGLTLAVSTALSLLGMLIGALARDGSGGTFVTLAWTVAPGILVHALVDMVTVLTSPTPAVGPVDRRLGSGADRGPEEPSSQTQTPGPAGAA